MKPIAVFQHTEVGAPGAVIAQALALIRDADARGIPVAGHCLGSQLVALALGGEVHRHDRPEKRPSRMPGQRRLLRAHRAARTAPRCNTAEAIVEG